MILFKEHHYDVQSLIREVCKREIAPRAAEYDRTHEFPWANIQALSNAGLMGMPIPEEYGGGGQDLLSYIITIEEISKACAATGVILAVHTTVGTMPILLFGTEEQKKNYVPRLAQGQIIGAFALTEPGSGSDASSIRTEARKDGSDYIINGSKIFITNGGVATTYIVFARTSPEGGPKGVSAFIVEKDTPGFKIGKKENKLGICASSTTELIFNNCRVPASQMLGQEGEGFKIAMSMLDNGRIGIGAQALGIAQAAYEFALNYSKERRQFGHAISDFQAISFILADMAMQIEAARLLVYQAAALKDAGQPISKEASMAKCFASDTAIKVTTDAVQVLGGYGYIKDFPVERYLRDAKITQIYEGTNQIQRLVMSKQILR